jgi:CheY-like chemotaxis protein
MKNQSNLAGNVGAACFFAVAAADMIYGALKGRDSLLSWAHVALGALGLFSLFSYRITEFAISKSGVTIKQQIVAAAALGAAIAKNPSADEGPEKIAEEAKAVAGVLAEASTPESMRRFGEATILWVDDRPANNVYERQAMEALGLRFVLSTSTEDALDKVRRQTFDAIISDMGRPPDGRAGYTLLDALRSQGDQTPFIIYAGSRAPEHVAESRRHGALGCTNRPQELIQLVLSAIGGRASNIGETV